MSVFAHEPDKLKEVTFMHDVDVAMNRRSHPWAFTCSMMSLLFFVVFFIWADIATIDDVTRGNGQVIPALGVQPIQSERGGTITDILVAENAMVERNQPVLTISNVQAMAGFNELQQRSTDLTLGLKRLAAEEQNQPLEFSEDEKNTYLDSVSAQMKLYKTGKEQYEGQVELYQSQLEARRKEVTEAKERMDAFESALTLLRRQEATVRPLVGTSYSQIDYLELRQRIVTQQGELEGVKKTIARAQSGVQAARERLGNLKAERQAKIADEISKSRTELRAVEQQIKASDEQVTRTELRSPVRGQVKRIILKKDSVAKPAEIIMEIIPTDGALEIEARFSPADRGFLYVNQEAMVKITTYDFSIYGGLEALIIKISDDTILDKRGEPWYEVRFLTKRRSLLYQGRELAILPGMTVSVDVLTDKKSVLTHIIGPIRRAMQSAMTEH